MNHITEAHRVGQIKILAHAYNCYCVCMFLLLGLTTLLINSFIPGLQRRRQVAHWFARAFFRAAGITLQVQGAELLPAQPCVVVANHASYIDGVVAVAALPPHFAFVIKREMVKVPLAGLLLRRLGSEFVERFDRHKGAADARRVLRVAAAGQSLVFFPEGTFTAEHRVGRFLSGAFTIAARSAMPVVAVAVHGTRNVFPAGRLLFGRFPLRFQILAVLPADEARQRSRELIAAALGEPLAP